MHPIYTYRITPDLFGRARYQAEGDPHPVRFCRRGYSSDTARRKLARDMEAHFAGRESIMQRFVLPLVVPVRRPIDKLARHVEQKRRSRARATEMGKNNG